MYKIYFITLFCFLGFFSNAQTVLLEENVEKDTITPKWGQNYKNYQHFYIDYGFLVDQPEKKGADIKYGNTHTFSIGYRYKRRLCNFYAIGFDLSYYRFTYNLKQDSNKILPNTLQHNKEKLIFNNLSLELYNRFNIGRRGNLIGKFIDIGVYGNWAYGIKHFYRDELSNANPNNHANIVEVTNKNLDYMENINYGLRARVGINRYTISANYRLSNFFKEKYNYPELPRLSIGLQIGFY